MGGGVEVRGTVAHARRARPRRVGDHSGGHIGRHARSVVDDVAVVAEHHVAALVAGLTAVVASIVKNPPFKSVPDATKVSSASSLLLIFPEKPDKNCGGPN